MRILRTLALIAALLLAASCSNGGAQHRERTMTVFAPASLSGPFARIATDVEGIRKGLHVKFTFGDSRLLATRLEQGAAASVIATADEKTMAALKNGKHLAKGYRVVARDRL